MARTNPQRSGERISKVQRWLDLIAYLVGRRLPVAVEELMEKVPAYARDWDTGDEKARASVRRKFERDKDELRGMGIPLETVPYRVGALNEEMEGYRILRKDFYLPYLRLLEEERDGERDGDGEQAGENGEKPEEDGGKPGEDGEKPGKDGEKPGEDGGGSHRAGSLDALELHRDQAVAAVQGLRSLANLPAFPLADAARSALRKITFDLDPEAFGHGPILFAVPERTARAREVLAQLSDALIRRKQVAFTYHGIQRGKDTQRQVHPYGLLFQHSRWYLVGWDLDREEERLFRADRVAELEVNEARPNTPDYELPRGPVLERYRDRNAWELGEADDAVEARVRFLFPISLWAERNSYGEKVEEGEDGAAVRAFEVRQPHAFLRWVLSLAGEADIESPEALREELRSMAAEVAALYEGRGDEEPEAPNA